MVFEIVGVTLEEELGNRQAEASESERLFPNRYLDKRFNKKRLTVNLNVIMPFLVCLLLNKMPVLNSFGSL